MHLFSEKKPILEKLSCIFDKKKKRYSVIQYFTLYVDKCIYLHPFSESSYNIAKRMYIYFLYLENTPAKNYKFIFFFMKMHLYCQVL